jgi:hypothetical protein
MDVADPGHKEACIMATKQLDFYLGLSSLIYDKDTKRRTMYGAQGAFRPKPYGVEYRVLSNAWLQSEELVAWVYRTTIKAINDLFEGKVAYDKDWNTRTLARLMKQKNPDMYNIRYILDQSGVEPPPGYVRAKNVYQGYVPVAEVG